MPKIKLNVGAEFDVLSKDELDSSLKSSVSDFARLISDGVRYGKSATGSISTLGALLAPPVFTSATPVGSGGTFAAGTYFYKATQTTAFGETTVSNEVSATVVLNGSANLVVNPNLGYPTKIYRGTTSNGENTLVTTLAAGVTNFTDTNVGGAGTPPGTNTANVSQLSTTPVYTGGYLALPNIGPNPGFIWSVKNLTYVGFPTNGADLLINGYSNGDIAYALFNGANANGTTIVSSNGLLIPPGNDVYLGFRGNVTSAQLIMYYEEVKLEDIGKL